MRISTPNILLEMKMAHIYEKTDLGYIIWSHLQHVKATWKAARLYNHQLLAA